MFDGDYDILYKNFRKTSFSDGENFQQKIAARMSGGDINGKTSAIAQLDAIASNIPNLQISVPQHTETWNAEEESPWVIYIPQNFQEGVTKKLKAFDPKGVEHWIDADIIPDFPVVVVGTSERVDEDGNVRADFINEKSPINGRTAGYREFMYKINCTDISALENWALGAPELEYYVAGARNGKGLTIVDGSYYKPGKRKDIDDRWVTLDRFMFTWNRPDYDKYIAIKWIEIDDVGPLTGLKVKLKLEAKFLGVGGSQEIEYDFGKSAKSDDGGSMNVYEGESTDQIYDTGKMAWQLKSIK